MRRLIPSVLGALTLVAGACSAGAPGVPEDPSAAPESGIEAAEPLGSESNNAATDDALTDDAVTGDEEAESTQPGPPEQPTPVPSPLSDLDREPPAAGEGPESTGPLGSTEVEIETDEGTVQIGGGEVPASAAGVPLPDDFELLLGSETETDAGFSGTTAEGFDELVVLYEAGLVDSGFEITMRQSTPGTFVVFGFESDDRSGQVAITRTPGEDSRTIAVTIGERTQPEAG